MGGISRLGRAGAEGLDALFGEARAPYERGVFEGGKTDGLDACAERSEMSRHALLGAAQLKAWFHAAAGRDEDPQSRQVDLARVLQLVLAGAARVDAVGSRDELVERVEVFGATTQDAAVR